MLIASGLVAQVADFGLSRGGKQAKDASEEGDEENAEGGAADYYRSKTGMFPVRWTAPEGMNNGLFTTASDVWSFGIVAVEVMQNGGQPYGQWSIAFTMTRVIGGYKHEQPTDCPDDLYAILLPCWESIPSDRPSFANLAEALAVLTAGSVAATTNTHSTMGGGDTAAAADNYLSPGQPAFAAADNYLSPGQPAFEQGGGRIAVAETSFGTAATAAGSNAGGYMPDGWDDGNNEGMDAHPYVPDDWEDTTNGLSGAAAHPTPLINGDGNMGRAASNGQEQRQQLASEYLMPDNYPSRAVDANVGVVGAASVATAAAVPERCPTCKAKVQFCSCNVRRGTSDMASVSRGGRKISRSSNGANKKKAVDAELKR